MKAQSIHNPGSYTDRGKKGHFNYNITEITVEGQPMFEYNFVEVSKNDRSEVIKGLMKLKYSLEDEIAIINNYIETGTSAKYEEYVAYRSNCIQIADTGVGSIDEYIYL